MIYDITQSFEENITYGPFFDEKIPEIHEDPKKQTVFLGQTLNSPFGIPACPLTANSRYIKLMAALGYDLLTYKSVRSVEWRGNVFPHWQYITPPAAATDTVLQADMTDPRMTDVTMANSFGIHSVRPEFWQDDVNKTVSELPKGKILILSLMCTPKEGEKLSADATRLGKLAVRTDARIFELNLACPNTDGGKGLIYEDIEASVVLCDALKQQIGNAPLLVKVGYYQDQTSIRLFLEKTKGMIAGISTSNTFVKTVQTSEGKDAFLGRPLAGVSGALIRPACIEQAHCVVQDAQDLHLSNFVVIGIGGVTTSEHIDAYLATGADAVQSAVGAFANPYLAQEYKKG